MQSNSMKNERIVSFNVSESLKSSVPFNSGLNGH